MAIVTLTGAVDTLASGKSWSIEIDYNTQEPNLIYDEDDTAFTANLGNWYFSAINAYWDAGYVVLDWNTLFPDNYMLLEGSSVNQWIGRMERGKRYRFSCKLRSHNTAINIRYGLRGVDEYMWTATLPADSTWHTYSQEFTYNWFSGINQPIIYFDTPFDQNNEVWVDDVKIELLDEELGLVDSAFAVVEFGEWSVGTEDLQPSFVDGIKTSLSIRPLGGSMTTTFRQTLLDWLEVFNNYVCRVRYYDVTDPEAPVLVWRGKIDKKSVSVDLVENTVGFDVVDFVIANAELQCDANPLNVSVTDNSALLNNYMTIEDLLKKYCNYMDQFVTADTFYSTVENNCNIKGKDLLNRYCTLSGYDNGNGHKVKFSVYNTRYFSNHYSSPYGNTLGELFNDMAYAFQSKITPWLNGQILIQALWDVGGTEVTLAEDKFTEIETGIVDMEERGTKLSIVGTRTTMTPDPWANFELIEYIPWESTCVDGKGELRKFVGDNTLMFLSDRADPANANSLVADLLSRDDVVTQSYFVNNNTYTTPKNFTATYKDQGVTVNLRWDTFKNIHKTLVALNYRKARKFVRCKVTGVNYDPHKVYKLPWSSLRFKAQVFTIDWVNNETELYLIEV